MPRFLRLTALLLFGACATRSGGSDAGPIDASSVDGSASDAACLASCHLPDPSCHFTDVCHCGGLVCDDGGAVDAGTPDAGPACPATAPADATPCPVESQGCTYDACPGAGVTQTSCTGGTWLVTTIPCASHTCDDGMTCAADEVCVSRASGAVITSCEPNPCRSGPFDCSCAASLCGGGTCSTSGTEVSCVIDCGGCP